MRSWFLTHSRSLLVFFFTLLTRLLYLWFLPLPELLFLPYQTDQRAGMLAAGERIFFPDAWASFYQVVGAFYKLFGLLGLEDRLLWFALVQSVMAAGSAALLYLLSLRLFKSRGLALATGLAFALYYPLLYFNMMVLSETTFVLAVVAALYLLLVPERSPRTLLGAGLLLGLALISRPILSTFIPLAAGWVWWTGQRGLRVRQALTLLLAVALMVVGASAVNAQVGTDHRFSYNGNTGVNFAMTQCRIRRIEYEMIDGESFWFSPPAYWDTDLPYVETGVPFYHDGYYFEMGLDCLAERPIQVLTNFEQIGRVYNSAFYPNFSEARAHLLALAVWKWAALPLTLAFLAYPFMQRRKGATADGDSRLRAYVLLAALLLSMFGSVYLASPGEERYLVSYYFILLLYGLPVIESLWGMLRRARGGRALSTAAQPVEGR